MNTLTPLEYFAAHAPATPADWFEPVFTPIKIPPKPEGAEWCPGCDSGGDCDKTESCAQMKAWWEDKETRIDCNDHAEIHAKAAQWPWAWAKMVLEAHPDTKSPDLLSACRTLLLLGREPIKPDERADYERAAKVALSVLEPED